VKIVIVASMLVPIGIPSFASSLGAPVLAREHAQAFSNRSIQIGDSETRLLSFPKVKFAPVLSLLY